MEEILHAFGIDWRLIFIQIVNFALLTGVLWYFLYTPLLRLIEEREAKIRKGVLDAQSAEESLKSADKEKIAILKSAHAEAGQIVHRATTHALEKEEQVLKEADEKVARKMRGAQAEAEQIKERALKESEAEVAKMAMLAAEKILRREVSK